MILETIVTTQDPAGRPHIAPMGVHAWQEGWAILPFRPSRTLANLQATGLAVLNATDDVRVFAGCVTGQGDFPLVPADRIACPRLRDALAHIELELVRIEDDPVRPKLFCRPVHQVNHAPFLGFNRAQFAVLEAAILISRLKILPLAQIEAELAYLQSALHKTAGPKELEAWQWLMTYLESFKHRRQTV
ncbi:DUF447 family protein [Methylothermus subterraneus]